MNSSKIFKVESKETDTKKQPLPNIENDRSNSRRMSISSDSKKLRNPNNETNLSISVYY